MDIAQVLKSSTVQGILGCITMFVFASSSYGLTEELDRTRASVKCTQQLEQVVQMDDAELEQLRRRLQFAFEVADVVPNEHQQEAINEELARQGRIWLAMFDGEIDLDAYSSTMQALVYQWLTKSEIDDEMHNRLTSQNRQLLAIMSQLPKRLVDEFGVPHQLADRIAAQCHVGQDHFRSLLEYEFLRPSQIPRDEQLHMMLMEEMEEGIQQIGISLREALKENEQEWNETMMRRGAVVRPGDLGADLLDRQYRTTRLYLTSFYGKAVRTFILRCILSLQEEQQLFPLGDDVTSYGTRYKLDIGWVFRVIP